MGRTTDGPGGTETAAEAYDRLLVPVMMSPWAVRLADAARLTPGDRVLDAACGTGAFTEEALRRVGPTGTVSGLDLNADMLAVARRKLPGLDLREGSAEELPFGNESFDVAACQFGLMFVADRARVVRELVRVLRPGGRLALSVWDDLDRSPAYTTLIETIERHVGTEAGALIRAPFAAGDVEEIRSLLAAARLSSVEVRSIDEPTRFPSVAVWVEAEVEGWVRFGGSDADAVDLAPLIEDATRALAPYEQDDGTAQFALPAIIATARTPASAGRS